MHIKCTGTDNIYAYARTLVDILDIKCGWDSFKDTRVSTAPHTSLQGYQGTAELTVWDSKTHTWLTPAS